MGGAERGEGDEVIADWSTLRTLTTPSQNLALNDTAGPLYAVLNENCDGGADMRFTADNIPQGDGQLNHTSYLTGYKMRLALALWTDSRTAACGGDAQEMLDTLGLSMNELRNPTGTTRIIWTPEGMASRMLNDIVLVGRPIATTVPGRTDGLVAVTFEICSTFPYEMAEQEITTSIAAEASADLDNDGNTAFWPVLKVYGPADGFTVTNNTTGLLLEYDGDQPGASMIGTGEYVEIDMFRGTAFLNGNQDNMLPGIDFLTSDFWPLEPTTNSVTINGADMDILWQAAWL